MRLNRDISSSTEKKSFSVKFLPVKREGSPTSRFKSYTRRICNLSLRCVQTPNARFCARVINKSLKRHAIKKAPKSLRHRFGSLWITSNAPLNRFIFLADVYLITIGSTFSFLPSILWHFTFHSIQLGWYSTLRFFFGLKNITFYLYLILVFVFQWKCHTNDLNTSAISRINHMIFIYTNNDVSFDEYSWYNKIPFYWLYSIIFYCIKKF